MEYCKYRTDIILIKNRVNRVNEKTLKKGDNFQETFENLSRKGLSVAGKAVRRLEANLRANLDSIQATVGGSQYPVSGGLFCRLRASEGQVSQENRLYGIKTYKTNILSIYKEQIYVKTHRKP
jgi:hypothetical protein